MSTYGRAGVVSVGYVTTYLLFDQCEMDLHTTNLLLIHGSYRREEVTWRSHIYVWNSWVTYLNCDILLACSLRWSYTGKDPAPS